MKKKKIDLSQERRSIFYPNPIPRKKISINEIDVDDVMNNIFKDENLCLIRELLEQENERRNSYSPESEVYYHKQR